MSSFPSIEKLDDDAMVFSRSQRIGDWLVTCNALKNGDNETCSASQKMETKGSPLLSINILPVKKDNNLLARFVLPFGVYMPLGVWLETQGGERKRLTLTTCLQSGIYAEAEIDDELKEKLCSGQSASLILFTYDSKKKLSLPISLNGSRSAFDSLL